MRGFITGEEGARRSFVSGRVALLIVVGLTITMMLAMPLREYLKQKSEINSLSKSVDQQRSDVSSLQQQAEMWKTPEYIREQARQRLNYMFPGEVGYIVVRPGDSPNVLSQAQVPTDTPVGPWYQRLYNSLSAADQQPATQ